MIADVVDLDHIAIRVSDMEESIRFYNELLGLSIRDKDKFERGETPFVAMKVGGRHIHLFDDDADFEVDDEAYGHEHLCIILRSDDRDPSVQMAEILDDFREHGVQVDRVVDGDLHGHDVDAEQKPEVYAEGDEVLFRNGAYGHGVASYIRDPDGRIVELKLQ